MYFCRKFDPLGNSIRRFLGPLGGSGRIFVQQRLIPELPGALGSPKGGWSKTVFKIPLTMKHINPYVTLDKIKFVNVIKVRLQEVAANAVRSNLCIRHPRAESIN